MIGSRGFPRKNFTRKKALFLAQSDGFPFHDVQRCKQGANRISSDAPMSARTTIAARRRSLGIYYRRRSLTVTSFCISLCPVYADFGVLSTHFQMRNTFLIFLKYLYCQDPIGRAAACSGGARMPAPP